MLKACILGATGTVGQRFVQLLHNHPWFKISELLASERSAGRRYADAAKWHLSMDIPDELRDVIVGPVNKYDVDADVLFSALPADVAREVEPEYAKRGYVVCSNASAFRMEEDVPLVIPEINPDHLRLVEVQRRRRGWDGFIVTNPNCTVIVLALSLAPFLDFEIEQVRVASMQAISGAGYEGLPSMAILDNVIPYISGEERKVESEPLKIFGKFAGDKIENASFSISASCNRVHVMDGHTISVWVKCRKSVDVDDIKRRMREMRSIGTPTAPKNPLIVREEEDRPQPRMDRDAGNGMSVSVGRIRRRGDEILYTAMGHNTIRGAAGASVLNAELLFKEKYI